MKDEQRRILRYLASAKGLLSKAREDMHSFVPSNSSAFSDLDTIIKRLDRFERTAKSCDMSKPAPPSVWKLLEM